MARHYSYNGAPAARSKALWSRFILGEHGTTAIEYAVISGLIAVAILSTLIAIGSVLGDNGTYGQVASAFADL